jgi:hypothetical protein
MGPRSARPSGGTVRRGPFDVLGVRERVLVRTAVDGTSGSWVCHSKVTRRTSGRRHLDGIVHPALGGARSVWQAIRRGGSSAGQSMGLIIPGSWVRAPPAPPRLTRRLSCSFVAGGRDGVASSPAAASASSQRFLMPSRFGWTISHGRSSRPLRQCSPSRPTEIRASVLDEPPRCPARSRRGPVRQRLRC